MENMPTDVRVQRIKSLKMKLLTKLNSIFFFFNHLMTYLLVLFLKGHLSDGVIAANAKLVELDLSDNAFGPDGVKACVKLLTSHACYSLRILRLNNNGLGVGGGKVCEYW